MINIIHLLLNDADTRCYFCEKHFLKSDFPLQGKDTVEIHHISYDPEVLVLAHRTCHKKHHREERKKKIDIIL